MTQYEPIIGLEIHLHAKTKSKMFCRCAANYFHTQPNSHVCPVCMGLPGALPVPNQVAVEKCIQLSLALGCSINEETKFDRKNYFYPDLPKGYQISQYDLPIGYKGKVELGDKTIRIRRVHMEEDTGKSLHEGDKTLLDYNKSGLPLIEVVTEPDFATVSEVATFSKQLQHLIRFINVGQANMERGQLRYELNISLRPVGNKDLPQYKVEVKNIASISVLEKVINFEIKRQSELLAKGETPVQETRGIRDLSGQTYSQRVKEEADDYRYFPEPDIPPLHLTSKQVETLRAAMGELPSTKRDRYQHDWKLEPALIDIALATSQRATWFEAAVGNKPQPEVVGILAKWLAGDILAQVKSKKLQINDLPVTGQDLYALATALHDKKITTVIARKLLQELLTKGGSVSKLIAANQGRNDLDISAIVKKVVEANPKVVADLAKNPNAMQFLLGQVMKETRGQADPGTVRQELQKQLPQP